MSKRTGGDGGRPGDRITPYDKIRQAMTELMGLDQWMPREDRQVISISIKVQDATLFVIARRLDPTDGTPMVAFSECIDYVELLRLMNKDLDSLRWKVDQFAKGKKDG